MARKPEGKRICKCECGGTVRGVEQFGRLFTWCEKCTPVVTIIDGCRVHGRKPMTDKGREAMSELIAAARRYASGERK